MKRTLESVVVALTDFTAQATEHHLIAMEANMKDQHEVVMPDHLVYKDVEEAMRHHLEAQQAGLPAQEVERLRLILESQIKAAHRYHSHAMSRTPLDRH